MIRALCLRFAKNCLVVCRAFSFLIRQVAARTRICTTSLRLSAFNVTASAYFDVISTSLLLSAARILCYLDIAMIVACVLVDIVVVELNSNSLWHIAGQWSMNEHGLISFMRSQQDVGLSDTSRALAQDVSVISVLLHDQLRLPLITMSAVL